MFKNGINILGVGRAVIGGISKIMNFKKILFSALILGGLVLLGDAGVSAQTDVQAVLKIAEQKSGDKFTVIVKTPKGATVYGLKKPSAAMLQAIDKGLADLFAIAKKNRYYKKLNYTDYLIFIAKPDREKDADGNYSPAFAIPSQRYAGSIYDKGGYIYVAGMVINYNPCAFLITDYDRELERASDVVRFEGEHLILWHNDRQRYYATEDHSKGGGHPILN